MSAFDRFFFSQPLRVGDWVHVRLPKPNYGLGQMEFAYACGTIYDMNDFSVIVNGVGTVPRDSVQAMPNSFRPTAKPNVEMEGYGD